MSDTFKYGDPVKTRQAIAASKAGEPGVPAGAPGRIDRVGNLFNVTSRRYENHYTVKFHTKTATVWLDCWQHELSPDPSRANRSLLMKEADQ